MKINSAIQSVQSNTALFSETNHRENTLRKEPISDLEMLFQKYNRPLDSKSASEINAFMKDAKGSQAEKLETIEMALIKGVDLSKENLDEIHQALKSEAVDLVLDVETEPLKGGTLIDLVTHLKVPKSIQLAIKSLMDQGLSLKEAIVHVLAQESGSEISDFEGLSLKKILDAINDIIKVDPGIRKEPQPIEMPFFRSEGHSSFLESQESPQPLAALEPTLVEEEENWQSNLESMVDYLVQSVDVTYHDIIEHFDIKQYLIKETTSATIEAKATFETFQKNAITALDFEAVKKPEDMAIKLQKTIENLNKVIIKSNVSLFTDLYMERDLMKVSAQLETAQNLLSNRDFSAVKLIVEEVKNTLSNMVFEPSKTKIMAFATLRNEQVSSVLNEIPNREALSNKVLDTLEALNLNQSTRSAKEVFETLRFMGLNHEVEVANQIENKLTPKSPDWIQENVKEILLRMMKENVESRTIESGEKTLMDLSGQQMMNQSGDEQKRAFHFFNYPLSLDGELGQMKIYINGDQKNALIDPDNLSMYFAMDFSSIGPSGIKFTASQGVVDVVITSDRSERLIPYIEEALSQVEAFGYKRGRLSFEPYKNTNTKKTAQVVKPKALDPMKGFDFKV